jgi:hypothetical protein
MGSAGVSAGAIDGRRTGMNRMGLGLFDLRRGEFEFGFAGVAAGFRCLDPHLGPAKGEGHGRVFRGFRFSKLQA